MVGILRGPSTLAAILTPLLPSGEIDVVRLARHAEWIIGSGCDGIALFGTTGEASSFSAAERKAALEALLERGISPATVIVGTGCTALADAVDLSQHAVACGCAGMLVVPPYYFKPAADEGLFAFYAALVEGVGHPGLKICLYHFPALSGVPLGVELVSRLHAAFPDMIVALKDSSGDFDSMLAVVAAVPNLAVFTGDDHLLRPLLRAGGAGSITAGGNLWPRALALLRDAYGHPDEATADAQALTEALWRDCLLQLSVTEALKALLANATGNVAWLSMRPPLVAIDQSQLAGLWNAADRIGFELDQGLLEAIGRK